MNAMELKDYRISPMNFAIACVESSSPNASVDEKLKLYKQAYEEAAEFAQNIQVELNKHQ